MFKYWENEHNKLQEIKTIQDHHNKNAEVQEYAGANFSKHQDSCRFSDDMVMMRTYSREEFDSFNTGQNCEYKITKFTVDVSQSGPVFRDVTKKKYQHNVLLNLYFEPTCTWMYLDLQIVMQEHYNEAYSI